MREREKFRRLHAKYWSTYVCDVCDAAVQIETDRVQHAVIICPLHPGRLRIAQTSDLDRLVARQVERHFPAEPDIVRRVDEIEIAAQAEWARKLRRAVEQSAASDGPMGLLELRLDGWDLHELYTVLVAPTFEQEGCCAGCAELPAGWCRTCDINRKQRLGTN